MSIRQTLLLFVSLLFSISCTEQPVPQNIPPEPEPTPYMQYDPPPEGNTTVPGPMGNTTVPGPTGGAPSTSGMEAPMGATPAPTGGVLMPTGGTNPEGGQEVPVGGTPTGGLEGGVEGGIEGGLEGGAPLEPCTPGEVLGLCEVCGEDGFPTMPERDEGCPSAICPAELYSLNGDGACEMIEQTSPEYGYCETIGACYAEDEQGCEVVSTELVAEEGVCATILTCDGVEPPTLDARPDGYICNTWGECSNGACDAPAFCEVFTRYNTQNYLCQAGTTDNGELGCMFFVNGNGLSNNGETTCNDFCANSGTTCINGWNDANGSCNPSNNTRSCDLTLQTQVCVCEIPPAP